ncbi:hypothetical protein LELG_04750 [Lodderomyces elongisporus NRRL YB-4239]|uniref:RING-type domain-containing protein n=1 Tax=Lodderomyces elongisporus (strain ATCC 11503 / CBS 2605 / JCM 1781 / NBRC 1676 / NRRL YB-4239) TaxID=379508 RepID=A5E561_LODEL|nr:hypothetical protein LELG_04750 [Lodderomyces elongisporus NRRL YB-4239]
MGFTSFTVNSIVNQEPTSTVLMDQYTPSSTELTAETGNSTYNNGSSSSYSNGNTFIGSTPSTILFFIAVSVGVIIGLLFVFFTIRYFIRSKYGVLPTPLADRGIRRRNSGDFGNGNNGSAGGGATGVRFGRFSRFGVVQDPFTSSIINIRSAGTVSDVNREISAATAANASRSLLLSLDLYTHIFTNPDIQQRIHFLRTHDLISNLTESNLNSGIHGGRGRRRRRQRRRFSKMKKLTMEEVEKLFPQKTYYEWLHGGKERDAQIREGQIKEEEEEDESLQNQYDTLENNLGAVGGIVTVTDEDNSLNTLHTAQEQLDYNSDKTMEMKNISGIERRRVVSEDGFGVIDGERTYTGISRQATWNDNNNNLVSTQDNYQNEVVVEKEEEEEEKEKEEKDNDEAENEKRSLHFDSGSCAICLELIDSEEIVRGLICGHVFHASCLDPWLTKRRACCPMCKRDYLFKRDYNQGGTSGGDNGEGNGNHSNIRNNSRNGVDEEGEAEDGGGGGDENEDDDDEEDDDITFALEELQNNTTLQALIQDLLPLSDRAELVLGNPRYQNMHLEERARERARAKYGGFFKRIWWRIIGITREDLFHWSILTIAREEDVLGASSNVNANVNANLNLNVNANATGENGAEGNASRLNTGETFQTGSDVSRTNENEDHQLNTNNNANDRAFVENRV